MQTAQIKVEGMSCGCCVGKVENALKSTKCVDNVSISSNGDVQFDYNQNDITVEELKRIIEDAGFDVV